MRKNIGMDEFNTLDGRCQWYFDVNDLTVRKNIGRDGTNSKHFRQ